MTTPAIVVMTLSVGVTVLLFGFCLIKVLTAPMPENGDSED